MADLEQFPISVSLALDALSDATADVLRLESSLAEARAARDRLIRDAVGKVKAQVLQGRTGLSREQIYRIQTAKQQL